jgi:hypothetical protein
VRGVRCDISVLLDAGLLYAPPFYAFTRAAISRASFNNENFPLMNLGMNNRARKLPEVGGACEVAILYL